MGIRSVVESAAWASCLRSLFRRRQPDSSAILIVRAERRPRRHSDARRRTRVPAPHPTRTIRPTRTPICRRSRRSCRLSPDEQAKRFWLPAGYRLTPVLSDPLIEDPAQIAFDGNGRMFVVELRGYYQTPDGIDLIPPVGRISMHEDRDNDGVYEHHSVFRRQARIPAVRAAVRRQQRS